jgi:hypothetical protein
MQCFRSDFLTDARTLAALGLGWNHSKPRFKQSSMSPNR